MKFDTIKLIGANAVGFPIVGADPSGPFILKAADGLGPTEVAVAIAETAREGGVYNGRRAANRQIVLRVGLQPDWDTGQTPEELRTILYGFLNPRYGKMLSVRILQNGIVLCQTFGQISKFEVALFSADPEVQITTDCLSPYLVAPDILYQVPTKTVADGVTKFEIDNPGTAPSGFTFTVTLTNGHSGILTVSDGAVIGQQMDISANWDEGDKLVLDTRPGNRGVWKIKDGTSTKLSLLNNLQANSEWFQLFEGDNTIQINNTHVDVEDPGFGTTPAYLGV